jgi:iron-sulfur cluster repair protein YtfE (RIC family)
MRSALDTWVSDHHDYVWARLPFVVPMAAAVAHARRDAMSRELADKLHELYTSLVLHLDREERFFDRGGSTSAVEWVGADLHADHLAVCSMLSRIRDLAAPLFTRKDASPLERTLCNELARLDAHISTQIELEELFVIEQLEGRNG